MPQQAITGSLSFDQKYGLLTAAQASAAQSMFNNTFIDKAIQGG
jgi:hypothetical protein